ncbi:MAG: hypothetical protein AB9Q22_06285 [Candidatus Reddybacter sp.]
MSKLLHNILATYCLTCILPTFAQDCDEYIGAGVLPYVVLQDGSINVLLSHEQGRGWSSFGGGPKMLAASKGVKPRCETRRETALREMLEESRRVLSRQVFEAALATAEVYPRQYSNRDFLTFVVAIPPVDIKHFYSNAVPANDPGYHETNALGWVALTELLRLAQADKDEPVVPAINNAGLYSPFRQGLKKALRAGKVTFFKP